MDFNLRDFSRDRQEDLIDRLGNSYGLLAEYSVNGITYKSNNTNIIPRDPAGNIIIQRTSNLNKILVIEPIVKRYTTNSVLKAYDTTFQYYKFPVSITPSEPADLDININFDTISTRYVIPYQEYPEGVPNSYRRLNTSYESDWYSNNADEPSSGFTRLPFTGTNQSEPGAFTITPDILKLLQDEGKTIKFSVQMLGTPENTGSNYDVSFRLRIRRDNPSFYRIWEEPTVYTTTKGQYNAGNYPLLKLDYILNVNDIREYDKFSIEAVTGKEGSVDGNESWYLGDNTYWDLQLIDNDPNLLLNSTNGVTFVSPNTDLIINGDVVISGKQ